MRAPSFIITALVGLTVSISVAHAGTFTFFTPSGATGNGQPLNAEAVITTDTGSLSVTLENLEANPTNIAQVISDLDITINSGTGSTVGSSLANSLGSEITVNGDGTFILGSNVSTGWVYTTGTPTTLSLDGLGAGAAGPKHLIIGPPGTGNIYSNADGSIAGNGPHNPFLNQQAIFTIAGADLSADTIISGVDFSFGNVANAIIVPGVPSTPLPGTLPLFASGLGALGLFGWRRKRKARVGVA